MDSVVWLVIFLILGFKIGWWLLFWLISAGVVAFALVSFLTGPGSGVLVWIFSLFNSTRSNIIAISTIKISEKNNPVTSPYSEFNTDASSRSKIHRTIEYARQRPSNKASTSYVLSISSGLIIDAEPLARILSGKKTWEMRSGRTTKRETIALIQKGSKAIYGIADIVDVIGPLTYTRLLENSALHQIEPARLLESRMANKKYAWVLSNVRPLLYSVPYAHPSGAVIFVNLNAGAIQAVSQALR